MKAFLWHEINGISDWYYDGGSVLVIAESLERALEIAFIKIDFRGCKEEIIHDVKNKEPTAVYELTGGEEKVWHFLNAGCC